MLFVFLLLILAGAGLIFFALRSTSGGALSAINVRLGRYGLVSADTAISVFGASASRPQASGLTRAVERIVDRGRFAAPLADKLERADFKMTAAEFISMWFGAVVVLTLLGLLLRGLLGMIFGFAVGAVGPWIYLNRRITKRKRAFVEQLADMAQMMGNSMRAGFSIGQSMELVANEGVPPANHEFERVVTEIKLGLPMDAALDHLLARQPSEDLALMVVAINVQRQIGGNLSEILAVISQTIRERVRFERDLRTLTAQARYSSYIITCLPIGVAIAITLLDPTYESMLWTSTLGYMMIGVAVCMTALGFFFLRRIATIEV